MTSERKKERAAALGEWASPSRRGEKREIYLLTSLREEFFPRPRRAAVKGEGFLASFGKAEGKRLAKRGKRGGTFPLEGPP